MRFLRVVVPVTVVVALALSAAPEAGQSAAKANPTISQFLGAASPLELAMIWLWFVPVLRPAVPPKATSTVIVRDVVFAKVSSQRV